MNKVEDNVVVYTPCSIHDDGLHTYNVTIPEGMICSDVLPDLGVPCVYCVFSYLSASMFNNVDVQCSSCIQLPPTCTLIQSQRLHE